VLFIFFDALATHAIKVPLGNFLLRAFRASLRFRLAHPWAGDRFGFDCRILIFAVTI
jgi:hypothetical protein